MTKEKITTGKADDYEKLWLQCLDNIRKQYDNDEATRKYFNDWFAPIGYESYNPDTHDLLLRLPSRFLYLFIEYYGFATLYPNIRRVFGKNTRLSYRIMPPKPVSGGSETLQRQMTGISPHSPVHVHIDNARGRLEDGLKYYLKDKPVKWLPGYDHIVRWLTDNNNKGLLCFGYSGVGKSLICQKIIPALIGGGRHVVSVKATELHKRLEELKQQRIVIIDGLGNEPRKHYGDTDNSFLELCDNAERTGALLIITTSLSTASVNDPHYPDNIQHRYGDEVYTRLKAITHTARIEGESLR